MVGKAKCSIETDSHQCYKWTHGKLWEFCSRSSTWSLPLCSAPDTGYDIESVVKNGWMNQSMNQWKSLRGSQEQKSREDNIMELAEPLYKDTWQ